ncbi:MAG: DNA starvation/stationary phase protection protein [Azospirillum sp.]|nr:DNA starvation/stationary phase protection protein [Azospirillum sp.]MCA3265938.1 DNA starvation/stationary phase protection protein [Azospirillum sp.]
MKVEIGLNEKARRTAAEALAKVLASSYVLALKTQSFHWNVTGPLFAPLHEQFGAQYEALSDAVDEIAERIRALGHAAPGSFAQFKKLSVVEEQTGTPKAEKMLAELLADHEAVIRLARATKDIVEGVGDSESGDMMVERMQDHGKTAWMLRSQLA